MSNFLSILKKVGAKAITIEHTVAPLIEPFVPQLAVLDGILQQIPKSVISVEAANPESGQGQQKSNIVVNDFNTALALVQEIISASGYKMSYDAVLLQKVIDAQVLVFNSMAELKASFKIEPVAPSPTPVTP